MTERTTNMTTAWETAKGLAEKHASAGGIFVRLASNGDKVTGVFCGEPHAREVVWTGERYETFDAKNPAHQADGKRPSLRVAINFFVLAESAMKVIEGGTQWFKDVLKVRDKYGLDKWSFEIERHGEAGDPKTKYTILPEEKIDAALRQQIAGAQAHDLEAAVGGAGDGDDAAKSATGGASPASERPIDAAVATELVARMKALPRADVDAILAELGVQRVRDLKGAQVARAKAVLAKFEGEASSQAEVDPFA
jgi:hypothetical protein